MILPVRAVLRELYPRILTSSITLIMFSLLRHSVPRRRLPQELVAVCAASLSLRSFSVLNRPPPNYEGHVPLTIVERVGLAVGSAFISLFNPRRGGLKSLVVCSMIERLT
jgi:hypothetical protein